MSISTRSLLLGAALLATLVATITAPSNPEIVEVSSAAPKPVSTARPQRLVLSEQAGVDAVLSLRDRVYGESANTPFMPGSWEVQTSVPILTAVTAAPEPVPDVGAPPLPFRVLGQYVDKGQVSVFLQFNESTIVATEGSILSEDYKVEHIRDGVLTLTYLPLNTQQTLAIGS